MSKPIKVACSPLSKKIYAGTGTVQLISTDGNVDFEVQVKDLRGNK